MTRSILEAAQVVVDESVGTPTGVLVPLWALDQLAQAVDAAEAASAEPVNDAERVS